MSKAEFGISAFAAYVPPYRVDLREWCDWTGNSWDKTRAVIGESFSTSSSPSAGLNAPKPCPANCASTSACVIPAIAA